MSQLSMRVRQHRGGQNVDVPGTIAVHETYDQRSYLSTILLAHYHYEAHGSGMGKDVPPYRLLKLTLVAIPNGRLQDRYNPDHVETIWMAGRDAPSRGEGFRVRLSFSALGARARWRVQTIEFDTNNKRTLATWNG